MRRRPNAEMSRYAVELMPWVEVAPDVDTVEATSSEVEVSVADTDAPELAVLLGIRDPVVIGEPHMSVVGAGRVVMSAAATVTFVIATPVLV
jgi:hypothetical protein